MQRLIQASPEKGKQFSTSTVIHDIEREYKLRRENTGH